MRFSAFLLVFFHHLLPGGMPATMSHGLANLLLAAKYAAGSGLSLFSLRSAYLITELLLREREATGTIHLRAFYVRRILRIWPLYFGFLAFCYALGLVVPLLHVPFRFVLQYVALVGNWAFYHFPTVAPLGPLWSISVEEQFYLCWPFLALWGGRLLLLAFSLLLLPASLLMAVWLTHHATSGLLHLGQQRNGV